MINHKFNHNYTVIIPEFAGHMVHKIMILLYTQYTKSFLEVHKGMKSNVFGGFHRARLAEPKFTISHRVSEFQSAYTHLLKIQEKPKFITSKTCMHVYQYNRLNYIYIYIICQCFVYKETYVCSAHVYSSD